MLHNISVILSYKSYFICGLTNSFLSSRNHLTLMYTKNEYFPILHLWQKSIKKKIGFIDKVYRFPFTALDCIQKLMSEGVIVECSMLSTQHGWAVTHYPIKWKKFFARANSFNKASYSRYAFMGINLSNIPLFSKKFQGVDNYILYFIFRYMM